MFPENERFTGEWIILPIGLSNQCIQTIDSSWFLLENRDILPRLKKRNKFDHKGDYGHGLLVAGSYGKIGAAILGAKAALKTGLGLITCHIPSSGNYIIQTALPEAMVQIDNSEKYVSGIKQANIFSAIGIGPGIGTGSETQKAVHDLLLSCEKPLVIDADGLNILGLNKDWLSLLPKETILTPHPKEFERIAGKIDNSFLRLKKQIEFSKVYNCVVVLKGAHSSITTPDGKVFFNTTGNPGMASAGSGDVLTGIILSLLSQGYSSENACVTGVYLHGLAGDIAALKSCYESIIASDIIDNIGNAFIKIRSDD
jgi:NAD(P)H-hydrate epimerase